MDIIKLWFLIFIMCQGWVMQAQDTTFFSEVVCTNDFFRGVLIKADTVLYDTDDNDPTIVNAYFIRISKVNDFNLPTDQSICTGDTLEVEIPVFSSISWNTGSSSNLIRITEGGTYTVEVQNNNGCSLIKSTQVVASDINLIFNLLPRDCDFLMQTVMYQIEGGLGPSSLTLYSDSSLVLMDDEFGEDLELMPGDYKVEVVDSIGCLVTDSITIDRDSANTFELGSNISTSFLSRVEIDPVFNFEVAEIRCFDSSIIDCSDEGIVFEATMDKTLIVEVEDDNGCVLIDSIYITLNDEFEFYVPNIFSPNGDGKNDDFIVYPGPQIEEITRISIVNRWGGLVYNQKPEMSKAIKLEERYFSDLSNSIYTYAIEVKLIHGTSTTIHGSFQILR